MFRSSAGAGIVISFMAMIKILLSYLRAAPLVEAFLFSVNYSFGFMLVHVLHWTIATKQPAMTAQRIAAGLHSTGRGIDLDRMAELVNKVFRTQIVAVLGNLATVIPVSWLIAMVYPYVTGHHLVSPQKALHMIEDSDPVHSLALLHAAIAGIWLFVSGLVSGYYDNKALYTRMGQRVRQLRGLGRAIGTQRLGRLARYIEDNLGGLMGNLYFGILMGVTGTVGYLLGLPLDVRHVTFSSANLAIAVVGLDHHVSWELVAATLGGIALIAAINLVVSFGLALWVALRARRIRFHHGIKLARALGRRFAGAPLDFFIGPKQLPPLDADPASPKGQP
jgi:site-specific recombinase